ncbi:MULTISPECIES: hypothetical protein [unclassified Streptomyces]|uniref:hypothetical protein n=1 Tax=unclassified Streptomyces TaxID=2593676 RepID=UPI00081B1776|nr:hypothetical protein [Streptomyces sp. BvitLS-983]MYX87227.1 hypothetical protein [Streptomyces sp. SID4915]SCD99387.1 hypothetical protein GA0115250_133148 [Streptomyces sp. BvitLS-983]
MEPLPQPTAHLPLTDREAAAEAERILAAAYHPSHPAPSATHYRDDTPLPTHGPTPPVPQPDHRIVPAWAAGTAVASIGVGAGSVGLGCCAWLVLQGLASVTLYGVLMVTLPFAGAAMLATAAGIAVSKARKPVSKTVYVGPVTQHATHHHTSTTKGLIARTGDTTR